MLENRQLICCLQRKEELLRRSAVHRSAIADEARNLRPIATWVDLGIDATRKARACWETLAPFLSLWQARKRDSGGVTEMVANGFALAGTFKALWRTWT